MLQNLIVETNSTNNLNENIINYLVSQKSIPNSMLVTINSVHDFEKPFTISDMKFDNELAALNFLNSNNTDIDKLIYGNNINKDENIIVILRTEKEDTFNLICVKKNLVSSLIKKN